MKIRSTLIALVIASFPTFASAGLINGAVGFTGTYNPDAGTSIGTTDSLDFLTVLVLVSEGDLSGVNTGNTVINQDPLVFDGAGAVTTPFTLWTSASYYFNVYTIDVQQTAVSLTLSGTGRIIHNLSGNWSEAYWSITANGTNTFSGNTTTYMERVQVPEPATLSLLGAGLLGIGVFGRRRRRS